MEPDEVVSLVNLACGAGLERFDDELRKVLVNILDPNTPAKTRRKIKLEVILTPQDETRDMCQVQINCSSTLAAPAVVGTKVFVGMGRLGPVATEYNPRQLGLPYPSIPEK